MTTVAKKPRTAKVTSATVVEASDFSKIRYKCSVERPYYSALLYALMPIELPAEEEVMTTMAVDKKMRLYYHPSMLTCCTAEELVGVLVHEMGHILRGHHDRIGKRDPYIANLAGDMEINDDIKAEGLKLPSFVVYPNSPPFNFPERLRMEEYYDLILKNEKKIGGKGEGEGDGKGKKRHSCGSAAGEGNAGDWEIAEGSKADKQTPGTSDIMKDAIVNQVANDVIEHQKKAGNVPGDLVRWAEAILSERINWSQEIRSVVNNCCSYVKGMVDYTYSRRNRRQPAYGRVIIPGFQAPVPRIVLITDTSGSMTATDLGLALGKIKEILTSVQCELTTMSYDASLNGKKKVTSVSQVELRGGGGTDMAGAIVEACALKPKFDLVVVLTDGYTGWPNEDLNRKVVAVITQPVEKMSVPSWIKAIYINKK